ncbi:MAG: sigma-70 family RNA polymerase sigma factor [Rhizomicrobium sp.]
MTDWPPDRRTLTDLLRRVMRRTRGHGDAEDLLQSAFLRLQVYRAKQEVGHAAGFVVQAAANIAIDKYRHDRVLGDNIVNTMDVDIHDDMPLQDEVVEARERLRRVREGLDKLPDRVRKVFLMHRLGGMTYRQIAQDLGVSASTVEKDIAKAAHFLAEWAEGW